MLSVQVKSALMDFLRINMQLLSSVDYLCIIVIFYQLFGLSFWRHPFTAEHPLLSKRCKAQFLKIVSDELI